MQTERSPTNWIADYVRPREGWHVVRVVVALVLLVAAATKCHQCCTGPIPGSGILSARWFVICLVEAEWLGSLGLLLLAGILPKPAWAAALACFSAFALVSLGKGLAGEASCGCFGRWELNPFLTATTDAAIVASLLRWRPKQKESGWWCFIAMIVPDAKRSFTGMHDSSTKSHCAVKSCRWLWSSCRPTVQGRYGSGFGAYRGWSGV
jgi:hypothetical protein